MNDDCCKHINERDAGHCIRIPNGFLTLGGAINIIEVRGTKYRFEFHHYCGPMPCRRNGDGLKVDWPGYVWDAVQLWINQGRRMDGDNCVWTDDPEQIAEWKREERRSRKAGEVVLFHQETRDD